MKKLPLICILSFVLLIFLGDTVRFFEAQELSFIDLRFQLRGARETHPGIVIVEIDDASIKRIGHWPWPRSYHAALLNVLTSYHPRLILHDVLFTEESIQPDEDQLLAYAIKEARNVIASFFYHTVDPFVPYFPIPIIRQFASHLGYVNINPDIDGRVRRIKKSIHPAQGVYEHTSVVAAELAFQDQPKRRRKLNRVPVDRDNSFWINYPGPYYSFFRIPFHRVIEGQGTNDPELLNLLQDKFVIVGQTATGGGDFRATPFSSAYPGVGIQAAALDTLLTGNYIRRFQGVLSLPLFLLLAFLVSFFASKNPPRIGFTAVIGLGIFYLVWNFLVFKFLGWILPVFPALLIIVGTYLFIVSFQFAEIRFQREIMNRELNLAARIQESFLPKEPPKMTGVDVAYLCRFARVVGGDLYDWVQLGERRLGICVGDVSGKGVPAALYMARAISEWRVLAKDFQSASALLEALNKRLVAAEVDGVFVTLLYLILDLDSRSILLSNAGHEPLLVFHHKEKRLEWIKKASAQPLGLFPNTCYPEEKFNFEKGDSLVVISDGVKELRNFRGEEFGMGRIEKAVDSFPGNSAHETVQRLFHAMDEFSREHTAHDDRTVLCLTFQPGG